MEFVYKNGSIQIEFDKKSIILKDQMIDLDGLVIDIAGEYEKSGVLMYAYTKNDERLFHFRAEGYWIAYIPYPIVDITPEALDFLGTVDILVFAAGKGAQGVIEKIEPRLLVLSGSQLHEIPQIVGSTETISKYKVKEADLSSEKTGIVVLGN